MPLLIHAVPLAKNWFGGHYWRTPVLDTLPEELEYLPREEIKHRFEKLNLIAARTYPTVWPNIAVLFFILALAGAAGYALSKIGSSNLAIMGQGICFLLPIVIVVWIKVRKETKARARRRFKHQSQKLLRTWTAQDTQSHAMQWKIRLRSKSIANPWIAQNARIHRRRRSSIQQGDMSSLSQQQEQQQHRRRLLRPQEQELDQLQDHHLLSLDELQQLQLQQQQQQHFHAGTTVISMTDALQLDSDIPQTHEDTEGSDIATLHRVSWVDPRHRREHHELQRNNDGTHHDQRPLSFIRLTPEQEQHTSSSQVPPSAVVSMYQTFRARAQRRQAATVDSLNAVFGDRVLSRQQQQQHTDSNISAVTTTVAVTVTNNHNSSPATSSAPATPPPLEAITRGESPNSTTYSTRGASIWSIFMESMSNSLCCGIFFREPKVWLIEISLRECQLDEYALMVPSPVYCDYRLPGYDDAMAGAAGGVTGAGATGEIVAAASSSRTALNRHNGLPPAYENESDSGEDDDDFDEDEDEDDDLENDNTHAHSQIQGSLECQLMRPTPAHFSDNGFSSSSNSSMDSAALHSQPEMEMIQRPIDMTSVVVLSAPLPTTAAGTPSLSVLPSPSYGSTSNSSHEYTHDFGRMPESSTSSPSINEQP